MSQKCELYDDKQVVQLYLSQYESGEIYLNNRDESKESNWDACLELFSMV
jgi:hypothetical protein